MAIVKPLVYLIVGSTRVGRVGPTIATWVKDTAESITSAIDFKILDLMDFDLPLHSIEPHIPITGKYTQPETIRWSNTIKNAQGYIFITPIYNGSFPGVLKLYIDYLKKEWAGKPTGIVSYSHKGGSRAATALASVMQGSLQAKVIDPPVLMMFEDAVDKDNMATEIEGFSTRQKELLKLIGTMCKHFEIEPSTK
ncbi:NADPH-dependent FMN reductase-domain-containing protein [Myxozyma melibiosi]|uniref:NADPH-dependent FMN reductase-domain-containing protein n=1 Tax=Myxozyma melibiosi TaxID=54550 RepID=A0ABR1FFM5_9ASCO